MKIGIAGKLILILGSCALLVLVLTGLMEYHVGSLLIEREIENKLALIGNRLALTLRRSVYEFDRESVKDTLLAEFPEEGLEAAAVWSRGRQRLLAGLDRQENGRIVDVAALPQNRNFVERTVILHLSEKGTLTGNIEVGEFTLVFNPHPLKRQLLDEIAARQIKNGLMILLLMLVLGEIVRRALVNPLDKLHQAMLTAEQNAFNETAAATLGDGNVASRRIFAEMVQMTETFRKMLGTIAYRQNALSVSEGRYRELVENVDALVLTLDAELYCLFANQTSEKVFGCPARECAGRSFLDFIAPDEREPLRRTLEQMLASASNQTSVDTRLYRNEEEPVYISWSFSIAYDYSSEPVFFRVVGRNVTPQKNAEFALRLNEQRYRQLSQEFEAVLEGIADSLILFNPDLEVVWANRAACRQFGLSADEIKGRTCHQLWKNESGFGCSECVREIFQSALDFEGMRTTVDGRTWGVKGYPVRDGAGVIINVIQIASDLTEKMTLREEATRAAHLAALGGLSAGVAHEINNPTGLILMSVPVVQAVFDDILTYLDEQEQRDAMIFGGLPYPVVREEVPQNLLDILGGAQRIRAIVEDLKNFARQEARDAREQVDLGEVVNRALRLLGNLVKNSTRFFVLNVTENLPKVLGSSQRLEQVVVNLLQNACLALTSSEQAIEVSVFVDQARRHVLIRVRDEGVGIPSEIVGKITDPFYTTRRESGGTGLGLSVSARIINEHGGSLRIESEPGQGSTFTVELPISAEDGDGN